MLVFEGVFKSWATFSWLGIERSVGDEENKASSWGHGKEAGDSWKGNGVTPNLPQVVEAGPELVWLWVTVTVIEGQGDKGTESGFAVDLGGLSA